jgi:hypothetical protein
MYHRTNIKYPTVNESSIVLTSWVQTTAIFVLLMARNEEVPRWGNSSSIPFTQTFMEIGQLMYVIGRPVQHLQFQGSYFHFFGTLIMRTVIITNMWGIKVNNKTIWDTRFSVSRVNCCWPSPAQSFFVPSPAGLMTILYCLTTLLGFSWRWRFCYSHLGYVIV